MGTQRALLSFVAPNKSVSILHAFYIRNPFRLGVTRALRSLAVRAFYTTVPLPPSTAGIRSSPRRLSYSFRSADSIVWNGLTRLDHRKSSRLVCERRTQQRQPRRCIRAAAIASTEAAKSQGVLRPPSIVDDNGDMATNVRNSRLFIQSSVQCIAAFVHLTFLLASASIVVTPRKLSSSWLP